MKYKIVKILRIETTLDSSESIMFNKGGAHEINIKAFYPDDNEEEPTSIFPGWDLFDQIIVRVQMEKGSVGTFNRITEEAKAHRAQWDGINKRESDLGNS